MRRGRLLAVASLAAILGGCWIQPGFGPTRQGFTPFDGGTNVTNVATLAPAWRAFTGPGAHRPIVAGGNVVTSWSNHVVAVDLSSGALAWTRDLVDPTAPPDLIPSLGDPTWFYRDGRIHVPAIIQRFGLEFVLDPFDGSGTGGIVSNSIPMGAVAVTPDAVVGASAQVSSGGTVAVVSYPGGRGLLYIGGLGLTTAVTDPMLLHDRVWIGVGSSVVAFDFETCLPLPPPIPPSLGCAATRTIAMSGTANTPAGTDNDHLAITDRSGQVRVWDPATSGDLWTANLAADLTAPAIGVGRVIVGARSGEVAAFRSGGCGASQCEPVWTASTGSGIDTQPAIGGDVVYVGTADGRVMAFATHGCGALVCNPIWTGDANRPGGPASAVRAGPILAEGRVVVVLDNGDIVAFARGS